MSQRWWIERIAARAVLGSVTGSSRSASASSSSLAVARSRSWLSFADMAADRASKKVLCAALNRFHSSSSAARSARPASFHDAISSR